MEASYSQYDKNRTEYTYDSNNRKTSSTHYSWYSGDSLTPTSKDIWFNVHSEYLD
jgi:hypothetical protein